ncbi:MAG: DUF1107 domain-containing protein [Succinivibrionaceae bacterium]
MRIFKKYSQRLIVKHVKTFFKGRMYIQGRGAYEFDKGQIVMPDHPDLVHATTVNELNHEIATSSTHNFPRY